jgi:PadR family transcriptional regulator PadR
MGDRHMRGHHHRPGRGGRLGGRVRSFVQPRLLFRLSQKPAHGYELMEQLDEEEGSATDPALLYRTLHQFEEEGLVASSWDTEGRGPARRVYEITAEGLEYLHAWVVELRGTRERLDRFLREYEVYFPEEGR